MHIRPLRRRTRFERVVKTARDARVPASVRSALADLDPPKGAKPAVTAVVAATATSAAISAVRRRIEGTEE